MISATKPLEYICFFPVEIPTGEGPAFVFLAVDAFSGFAFNTGVEDNDRPETIIKHIYLLTEHPDFVKQNKNGFTLVLHKYQELESRIQSVISSVGGKIQFDGTYLSKIMAPVLKSMFQNMGKKRK